MAFQSLFNNSLGICLVTLLSTSVKSCEFENQHSIAPIYSNGTLMTDRNEEAACPIGALKHVREELQPGVVAVEDQIAVVEIGLCLSEPRVLSGQRRACIALGEIEYDIEERRDRA